MEFGVKWQLVKRKMGLGVLILWNLGFFGDGREAGRPMERDSMRDKERIKKKLCKARRDDKMDGGMIINHRNRERTLIITITLWSFQFSIKTLTIEKYGLI